MAVDYLSSVEQSVLDEINLARTNPSGYADILAQRRQYYQGNLVNIPGQVSRSTHEGVAALDEAISVLRSTSPLPALSPSRGMSLAAKDQVNDIGPKGIDDISAHTGSDGSNVGQRIDRYGDFQGGWGENIDFGASIGKEIAIRLLVDDGVSSRGHRDNILKPSFRFAGVSVGAHAKDGTMAVIDFADQYKEASAPPTTPVPIPTPPPVPIAPPSNTGSDGKTVFGTAGSDTLQGGSGTYILYGGKGDDLLLGSEGNDGGVIYAYGGSGNDIMAGGFGNDILIGGKGDDYLIGTDGTDTFVGSSGSDTFAFVSDGLAIISDFDPASDYIELLDNLKGSRVFITRNTTNSIGVFVSTNGGSSFDLNLALLTNYTGDLASVSQRIIGGAGS
jgi:Ca2+-binding RTX toxin-like protein